MDDLPPDLEAISVDNQDSASLASRMRMRMTLRQTPDGKVVGRSDEMVTVLSEIDKVARSNCTVLITGESGTGNEMVVSALHDASPRRRAPLVVVNCGAIPENLLESELFGHAKGAFTGAHAAQQGRVAAAEGGTLFLDEVGELPLALQVKLLRLMQQHEYSPVGDSRTMKCDIRVVAATNRDLEIEVRDGRFREDLYYRLALFHVHIPALRERAEDVEPLAMHFLRSSAEHEGRNDLQGFSPDALELLTTYEWPGNVPALRNAIERAVLLAPGPYIRVQDLPTRLRGTDTAPISGVRTLPDEGIDLRAAVEEFESNLIRQALEKTGGNKNKAAQLLRLNRTTLVEMVKRKRLSVA